MIESYKTLCSTGDLHSVARTPQNFRGPSYRIQVSLSGIRVSEHTLPGPREASIQRSEHWGISGVRVTEHKFLCPRETTIQRHGPVNFKGLNLAIICVHIARVYFFR